LKHVQLYQKENMIKLPPLPEIGSLHASRGHTEHEIDFVCKKKKCCKKYKKGKRCKSCPKE